MINMQAVKFAQAVPPGVIKDNASWTGTTIDCLGFDYATIVVQFGAMDIAMVALKVTESNDDSTYVDITATDFSLGTQYDMDGTLLALPSAGDDNTFQLFHIDLRKRHRYLKLVATGGDGTAGTYMSSLAILSRAEQAPKSSAGMGADQAVVC